MLNFDGRIYYYVSKKIERINNAHVIKAEKEKTQSEELLATALEVAAAISANIENVVVETEHLKKLSVRQAMP